MKTSGEREPLQRPFKRTLKVNTDNCNSGGQLKQVRKQLRCQAVAKPQGMMWPPHTDPDQPTGHFTTMLHLPWAFLELCLLIVWL